MSDFDIDAALMEQAARLFIKATSELAESLPHPGGRPVRISLEVIGGGSLGEVAIDVTNLWALAQYAARRGGTQDTIRHADPAPSGKAKLRLVQGDA
ncbi:hypothetical protein D3C59_36040, partial [Streptomyces sp. SHP22-7]